ncbi:MAG: hypothetical protein ACRC1H_02690 [Caldilineaceae bacterium]
MWNEAQGIWLAEEREADRQRMLVARRWQAEAVAARKASARGNGRGRRTDAAVGAMRASAVQSLGAGPLALLRRRLGVWLLVAGEWLLGVRQGVGAPARSAHTRQTQHSLLMMPGLGTVLSPVRGRPAPVVMHRRTHRRP